MFLQPSATAFFLLPLLMQLFLSTHTFADSKVYLLDTIVTTASRIATPLREVGASVSVIEREEIELRGYQTLADVLRNQPGITVSNSGGQGKLSTLNIRGEEGYRTQIVIDGVRIADPSAPQVLPRIEHMLTSGDIERIEILRGPQGLMYGADAGGIIKITTGPPREGSSGMLSTEVGRYDTERLSGYIANQNEKSSYILSLTGQSTAGFNARTSDLSAERDGYDNITAHGKFTHKFNDNWQAEGVIRDINADNEFDQCFNSNTSEETNDCKTAFDQTIARLSLTQTDSPNSQHFGSSQNVSVEYSDLTRDSANDGARSSLFRGEIETIEYRKQHAISENIQWILGADQETQRATVGNQIRLERDQLGLYGEIQNHIGPLTLTAGIRHDQNEDFGEHNSLRATAAYVTDMGNHGVIKYRASSGSGFRAPSLNEIAYNAGPNAFGLAADTVLTKEQSKGVDAGIDYFTPSGIELSLTYFDQVIRDEIFFDLADFSGYLQATGDTQSKGAELSFAFPIATAFTLSGHYTYNSTQNFEGYQRIRRPQNIGNVSFSGSPNPKTRFIANYRFSRNTVDASFSDGRFPLDDYGILDISLHHQLTPNLKMTLRIENLLNEDYQEAANFNTPGQAVYSGFTFNF